MGLADWWRRLAAAPTAAPGSDGRIAGRPTSANGASSFHLRWHLHGTFDEVSVTIAVVEPPRVASLYFWALQADFAGPTGARAGGAHLGLQWHPSHPGSRAVNWGGYDGRGTELHGSPSGLPSALGNMNTRDLAWSVATPYRLTVRRAPEDAQPRPGVATAWRGTVTDLHTGVETVVRDLYPSGDRIVGVTMWSEVFADCDAPSVAVRWSDPSARTVEGRWVSPGSLSVNYQAHTDGGCVNTDSAPDGLGVVQRTAAPRSTPQGVALPVR